MTEPRPYPWWGALLLLAALFAGAAGAAPESSTKPFAERFVVLQISDPDPFKQTLVLNVANNLVKHYGPDRVDVEVVAFGPGLRLLLADNTNRDRIDGLVQQGVRFSACSNTLRNFTQQLGEEPTLHAAATTVPAGVVRIIDRVAEGYTLVKP